MINPGINLCSHCGKTSTGFYYCSDKPPHRVWVLEWVSKSQKLRLRIRDNDSNPKDYPQLIDPSTIDQKIFPPYTLDVPMSYDHSDLHHYTRCCPECGKPFANEWIGLVPGYVIAVLGIVGSGKTSWIDALSTSALVPLNAQSYSHSIFPGHYTGSENSIVATLPGTSGGTNYFRIVDRHTREVAALVYLLDFAGENCKASEVNPSTPLGKLLMGKSGVGYTGIDGLVLIEPSKLDYLDPKYRSQSKENTAQLIEILDKVCGNENMPIAHVLTFGDKLLADEQRKPLTPKSLPMLTEKTFPIINYTDATYRSLKRYFTPERINKRFLLHQTFAPLGENHNHLAMRFNHNIRHFLVQSCTPIENEQGNRKNNHETQFNAVDPLLWLLTELQLFSLNLNNGGNPYA